MSYVFCPAASEPIYASIGDAFPDEVANICRHCLRDPQGQRGYFRFFDLAAVLAISVDVLGQYGSAPDVELLVLHKSAGWVRSAMFVLPRTAFLNLPCHVNAVDESMLRAS
jgi:hypothetical protein